MSPFPTHLLLELTRKICLQTTIKQSTLLKMRLERRTRIQPVGQRLRCMRWMNGRHHVPLLAKKQRVEKCCHLSAIAQRRRHKRRDWAIQIDAISSFAPWLGPEHQLEEFDVFPEILVVARCLNCD